MLWFNTFLALWRSRCCRAQQPLCPAALQHLEAPARLPRRLTSNRTPGHSLGMERQHSDQLLSQLPTGVGSGGKGREITPPKKLKTYFLLPQNALLSCLHTTGEELVPSKNPVILVSKEFFFFLK